MKIIVGLLIIWLTSEFGQSMYLVKNIPDFNFDYFNPKQKYPEGVQETLRGFSGIVASLASLVMFALALLSANLWQSLFNLYWVPFVAVGISLFNSIYDLYWAYTNKMPLTGIISGYYGKQFYYWENIFTYSVFVISYILILIYD